MIAELPLPDSLFGLMFQMTNYFIGAAFLSTFLAQVVSTLPLVVCVRYCFIYVQIMGKDVIM